MQRREHETRGYCFHRIPDLASGNVVGRSVERVDSSHVSRQVLKSLKPNLTTAYSAASLLTHILATAWGGFQIVRMVHCFTEYPRLMLYRQYNTEVFHRKFSTLTTQGACGINLLPNYWKDRSNAEIPSLALNVFALLVSAFLSWRLMKVCHWSNGVIIRFGWLMLTLCILDFRLANVQACRSVAHYQPHLQHGLDVLDCYPARPILRRCLCRHLG